ncbi:hypothetical protein F1C12_02035 [Leifsonia shinshuensis]|uniref:Uncharacterized protein n=1 Tax=Leifsonia shinshuensis TaxID=150026 RepID=A0A7G6Y6C4_9MICO|nr:hypothetical protein [Leifsonia shinshuensis]QNE34039.1 hypothetical protein F1C12_02035 [Leifsonia shinshuensis]
MPGVSWFHEVSRDGATSAWPRGDIRRGDFSRGDLNGARSRIESNSEVRVRGLSEGLDEIAPDLEDTRTEVRELKLHGWADDDCAASRSLVRAVSPGQKEGLAPAHLGETDDFESLQKDVIHVDPQTVRSV